MIASMAAITIRNLPDDIHRALKVRAAQHDRSTEAEIRDILTEAVKPPHRLRLGAHLAGIGRRFELADEDVDLIATRRQAATPIDLA
jgi:antitoxin FitA